MPTTQTGDHAQLNVGTYNDTTHNYYNSPEGNTIDKLLAPAQDTTYDRSGFVPKCYDGTREDVVAAIENWVDNGSLPICWLRGPAGYGKSAIAHAVAERYHQTNRLIGNFFFSRGHGDRTDVTRLVPTLSYQLYHGMRATRASIEEAVDADPLITTKASTSQFNKLIIEPLRAVGQANTSLKNWIIVIDALDECEDKNLMRDFINALIKAAQSFHGLPLRILITSRVEEHVREILDTTHLVVYSLSLEEFDARADIHAFLKSRLSEIYKNKKHVMGVVSPSWPSGQDLDSLVENSGGSFLFAATSMKLICGDGLPQDNLHRALTANDGLDSLYKQVIGDGALSDENFAPVLGTVILLKDPIPTTILARLLQLRPEKVVLTLQGLQSIIMIPADHDQSIQLFHASLRDFLIAPERSQKFFIDPSVRHIYIAQKCWKSISTVTWLPNNIFYSDEQKYACLNWCYHLDQGLMDADTLSSLQSDISFLEDFVSKSIHIWVNTLLLNGEVRLDILRSAISKLKALSSSRNVCKVVETVLEKACVGLRSHMLKSNSQSIFVL